MRSVVSLLSAAAILLHLVLGCCAHHAHATENGDCANHSLAKQTCSHHHHQDSQPENTDSGKPHNSPHNDCHEGGCVFLNTTKGALEQDIQVVWLPAVISEMTVNLETPLLTKRQAHAIPPPPALGLTLLFQHLLI